MKPVLRPANTRRPVTDVSGKAFALTVFTPIVDGRTEGLRSYLADLPTGPDSPLARWDTTHFARWVVIDHLVYQAPPQAVDRLASDYLLFSACFDGRPADYGRAICTHMPAEADAIWGACHGHPGVEDPDAFTAYLRHNHVPSGFFVSAHPDATVSDVRDSLALRERLVAFAAQAQSTADPAGLQAAFLERFGAAARGGDASR